MTHLANGPRQSTPHFCAAAADKPTATVPPTNKKYTPDHPPVNGKGILAASRCAEQLKHQPPEVWKSRASVANDFIESLKQLGELLWGDSPLLRLAGECHRDDRAGAIVEDVVAQDDHRPQPWLRLGNIAFLTSRSSVVSSSDTVTLERLVSRVLLYPGPAPGPESGFRIARLPP
jgi:hypothetical protein